MSGAFGAIPTGKIDATLKPVLRGEAIPVRLSHIQHLRELLEQGKVEQVKNLLNNLLKSHLV